MHFSFAENVLFELQINNTGDKVQRVASEWLGENI